MTSLEALQTPEQDSGWIEHDGKGMPVDGDTQVIVEFRDGQASYPEKASYWKDVHQGPDFWTWMTGDDDFDILAYRLHKPTPSSQGDAQ